MQVPREGTFDIVLAGRNSSQNETRLLRGEILGVRAGATGLVLKARAVEATRTLRVRVLAPDGTPTDAPVLAWPTARPFYVSTQGGIAEIGGLPDEEVTVRAGRPEEWSWAPPAPIRVVPRGQEVTLRFRKAGTIVGSVLLPDGSPATQTYIHAYAGREDLAAVTTEQDGTFRLAFEPDVEGPIRLEARRDLPSDREHVAVLDGIAPGATGVELRLAAVR